MNDKTKDGIFKMEMLTYMFGERDRLTEEIKEIRKSMDSLNTEGKLEALLRIKYIEGMVDCYSAIHSKIRG
ncbi:MAG: hypothetical protein ACRCX2_19980 [Paraclostridium sp.]